MDQGRLPECQSSLHLLGSGTHLRKFKLCTNARQSSEVRDVLALLIRGLKEALFRCMRFTKPACQED